MSPVFQIPSADDILKGPPTFTQSSCFYVSWPNITPQKMFDRINKPIEISLGNLISTDVQDHDTSAQPDVAFGSINDGNGKPTTVRIHSVDPASVEKSAAEGALKEDFDPNESVRFQLMRCRWCTSIKKELFASIEARRVD